MHVKLRLETLAEMLYFLNWLVKHMTLGGVGEYSRLSRLIWKMYQEGVFGSINIKNYPTIHGIIKNFSKMQEMEEK